MQLGSSSADSTGRNDSNKQQRERPPWSIRFDFPMYHYTPVFPPISPWQKKRSFDKWKQNYKDAVSKIYVHGSGDESSLGDSPSGFENQYPIRRTNSADSFHAKSRQQPKRRSFAQNQSNEHGENSLPPIKTHDKVKPRRPSVGKSAMSDQALLVAAETHARILVQKRRLGENHNDLTESESPTSVVAADPNRGVTGAKNSPPIDPLTVDKSSPRVNVRMISYAPTSSKARNFRSGQDISSPRVMR